MGGGGTFKATGTERGAEFHYDLMSIKDIQELPVADMAADDCILFIWVTFPLLQEGLDTIKAWGFEYKTVAFTWVKRNKRDFHSWKWGLGHWTRSNAELCLLATRGKPHRISAKVHSVVDTPIEGHSKKPDLVRKRIVELMGDLTRIELFARIETKGWDTFGNEVKEQTFMEKMVDE